MAPRNTIRAPASPPLPYPPYEYSATFFSQFNNVLRLFFNQVVNFLDAPRPHGGFCTNVDQTNPIASAVNRVSFVSKAQTNEGVELSNPTSRIIVRELGTYDVTFSLQIAKTTGGTADVYVWTLVNGEPVPNSGARITANGNGVEAPFTHKCLLLLNEGDYIELAWSSSDTDVFLNATAASGTRPAVPSASAIITFTTSVEL
jgi:hypothetical protein